MANGSKIGRANDSNGDEDSVMGMSVTPLEHWRNGTLEEAKVEQIAIIRRSLNGLGMSKEEKTS